MKYNLTFQTLYVSLFLSVSSYCKICLRESLEITSARHLQQRSFLYRCIDFVQQNYGIMFHRYLMYFKVAGLIYKFVYKTRLLKCRYNWPNIAFIVTINGEMFMYLN